MGWWGVGLLQNWTLQQPQALLTFFTKKNGPATHFPGESAGPQGMGDLRFLRKRFGGKSSINNKKIRKIAENKTWMPFIVFAGVEKIEIWTNKIDF